MADNKLSWTELRRALASRAGVSEKEANAFLSAFNTQLTAALKSDKQVKVNGLGTFKLQAVAPRKSVNVTTGEQITIEGYNKIAFVPEAGVRELVEKGVKNERVKELKNEGEVVDPLKKLGAQAEEIVDLLGELGQDVKVDSRKKKVERKKPKAAPKAEPVQPVVEPEPAPIVEPTPAEEKPKKKYHFMRDTLICVVVLLMLLLAGYFFLRSQLSGWINELVNPSESVQKTELSVQTDNTSEEPAVEMSVTTAESAAEEWSFDEILLTEQITEGSRLAWIAKKYYGNKAYWPYIYAANKDHLTNPSLISVGTPIRVPKLNAAMRDTTDIRFQQLREEAMQAMK